MTGPPRIDERPGAPPRLELRHRGKELDMHPLLVRLLHTRGVHEPQLQRLAFDAPLSSLRDPSDMAGFERALELVEEAVTRRWRVGVFGDYDVDGVSTAAILATYLEALGLEVVCQVARRDHGYGLTVGHAERFADAGVHLMIAGDVGTSDVEALGVLQARGVRTIVIDHHQVPEVMPPADALINPHRPDCGFGFKGLCSAGVAFYLCAAGRRRFGGGVGPDPRDWLDLVAVATVCDMMPLRDENRALVKAGLRRLAQDPRPGLVALLRASGVDPDEPIDEETIGFRIGPRLNAPGRLGAADPALRILMARTVAEAQPLAEQIEALNARRKRHTEQIVAEAMALAETGRSPERGALVLAGKGWLPGIVGIAAAKVAQTYDRPAALLAIGDDGVARGSVRSVMGVDVRACLAECADLLDRFGGHREAAGLTLRADRIAPFAAAFEAAVAHRRAPAGDVEDREVVDCHLPLRLVDDSLCRVLAALGPYGMGFERPRFWADRLVVATCRVLKERHLAVTVAQGDTRREAIAFGQADHGLVPGDRIGCVFVPKVDRFRGMDRVKLHVERLWKCSVDGDGPPAVDC